MNKETTFLIGVNLTHEAEAFLGPWRPISETEIVNPSHISEADDGTQLIPMRLYGKGPKHDFYDLQIFAADD